MPERGPAPGPEAEPSTLATALVVGADKSVVTAIRRAARRCKVEIFAAPAGEEARSALLERRYDVVLVADQASDGSATGFAQLVARLAPTSKTMLLSETVSVTAVLDAMRRGVIDYVQLPFEQSDFRSRLLAAVERSRDDRQREDRVTRLKGMCKRLSDSRTEASEEAKNLSEDLREAREDLQSRLDEVAMVAEYRTLLRQELDLEDLLRVGVEYLVGKTGPTNAAVFLPGGDGEWSLGAYVNCDCPRTVVQPMLDRFAADLCPELAKTDELMRFEDSAEFTKSLELGHEPLEKAEIVAWPCRAGGECLAVFVLFRDRDTGFADGLAGVIDSLRGIFAEQVATILRIHHRAVGGWPKEQAEHDEDEWDKRDAA